MQLKEWKHNFLFLLFLNNPIKNLGETERSSTRKDNTGFKKIYCRPFINSNTFEKAVLVIDFKTKELKDRSEYTY